MRIRILPLALVAALAACNGSPAAPEMKRAESSTLMGGGTLDGDVEDPASPNSAYTGGGTRTDEPAERNPFMGGSGG